MTNDYFGLPLKISANFFYVREKHGFLYYAMGYELRVMHCEFCITRLER